MQYIVLLVLLYLFYRLYMRGTSSQIDGNGDNDGYIDYEEIKEEEEDRKS